MALKVSSEIALMMYHKIRESVVGNEKDFRQLHIKCYICYTLGHIAIDCKQFHRFKGNLIRYYKKIYKLSIKSDSDSNSENKKNPLMVSLASKENAKRFKKS